MKRWLWIIYGLLLGLLSAGAILLISNPRQGQPIVLSPAPSPTPTSPPEPSASQVPIQAQIGGEVASPGVYALAEDQRLRNLIEMAGGLTAEADQERVNLAMPVRDGDYFFIPSANEEIPETARNAPENMNTVQDTDYNYPLDLNDASQEALESIPGIGPAKAEDILAYKAAVGGFTALEELLNVSGIGEATLESLKDYLYVEP